MFPLQSKNLRRMNRVRSLLYIVMLVVGLVLLAIRLYGKH